MPSKKTETVKADPYAPAQPMIREGLTSAQGLFNRQPSFGNNQAGIGDFERRQIENSRPVALNTPAPPPVFAQNERGMMRPTATPQVLLPAPPPVAPTTSGPTATNRMGGYEKFGGGFRIDPYSGDMVADMSTDQLRANQMVRDAAPGQMANIQGAQDTVLGLQNQQYYDGFQGAIDDSMNAQETDDFRTGINSAMDQSFDPRFNAGLDAAQNTQFDDRFDAITGAPRANDARFDNVINRETDPNAGLYMTDNMRRNIIEGIAPNIQGTFGKSGMANSSLHAQNLAKGLGAGLAPVEYQIAADSRHRALQAAGMAQGAYESGKGFDLTAGQARQSALDAGRNRSMAAGAAAQGYRDAGKSRALAAGTAGQSAYMDRLKMATDAAGQGQSAMDYNEQQAMAAAGMMPGLNDAYMQPIRDLDRAGSRVQQQQQNEINAKMLRDQQAKSAEMRAIQDYLQLTSGVGGQFSTKTGTTTNNPGLLEVIGGGLKMLPFL